MWFKFKIQDNLPGRLWFIWKWFKKDWWRYILGCRTLYFKSQGLSWRKLICRLRGHPYPVSWYNLYGDGPDMHCTNCGDDLS